MIYLSIVIPIRNEENYIVDTLSSLVRQDYDKERYELLVVDGQSEDNTRLIVNEFIQQHEDKNIRLLDNPGCLSSRARNIGASEAKGQLIGVIDGHVHIPNDQLFSSMERLTEDNNAMSLARPAPLDVPGLKEGKPFWIAVARKTWLGHSRNSFIYSESTGFVDPVSSGFAYHRSVFDAIGYFDESFDAAEDVEFHHRMKKADIMAYTSPDLLIYSYPRETFFGLFKQQTRYGEGRVKFISKHPEGFTKETLIPLGIFLMFALYPLVIMNIGNAPGFSLLYSVIIMIYCAVLSATGLVEGFKRGNILSGFLVTYGIWVTHMGIGWGMIKCSLSSSKRTVQES